MPPLDYNNHEMKKWLMVLLVYCLASAQQMTILDRGFRPFDSPAYITPTSSPCNSVNINWNTAKPESSRVAYGSSLLEDTVWLGDVSTYHHVRINNLKPDTWYYYKVLPEGDILTFHTFPLRKDTFDFIVYGDTRSDSAAHHAVISRMLTFESDFIIHTGDLVKNGASTSDWKTFFIIEDQLLRSKHFMPVVGNHESPYWPYDTLFALPDADYFYSVDYGNSHFIFLDTQRELGGVQRNWLINDLIDASEDTLIAWIFVTMHRPPYSSGNHGSQKDVRNAWCSIFERFGVDMVFAGHDHNYERMSPINDIVYMVIGGGGAPLYDIGKSPWTVYSDKTYHFCHFKINGSKLSVTAIRPDGEIIDSFSIEK